MADMTYLSKDIWTAEIASLLDKESLFRLGQVCKSMQLLISSQIILKPLYNRLCALDQTLSADLPEKDSFDACEKAFFKIEARQKEEIAYLQEHHPCLISKYDKVWKDNTSATLASLEAKNAALDEINSKIITKKIDVNGTSLFLGGTRITRFPTSLFQVEKFMNFWKNLRVLHLAENQLTALNLQSLVALETLYCCYNNQLTVLNLQGLAALHYLECHHNKLNALYLEGLVALNYLDCSNNKLDNLNLEGLMALTDVHVCFDNNPLRDLNLTGVLKEVKDKYAELEKSLSWKKLDAAMPRFSESTSQQEVVVAPGRTPYCPFAVKKMEIKMEIKMEVEEVEMEVEMEMEVEVRMEEERENKKRKRPEYDKKLDDSKRMKKG